MRQNLVCSLFVSVFCLSCGYQPAAADGDRLTYLDEDNPWYPHRGFAKLTTPQWVGEEGVDAVVVLAIDDMRGHEKWEAYLRPILDRLKQIDGRAPLSIMTCQIDPADPHLQTWLREGLSLEVHTFDHPCPLLQKDDLAKAKVTYDRCVDLLSQVPGNRPVAFRTPCCDSLNTVSPRFFTEIFNRSTPELNYLSIDSSVFNFFTPNDPALPRELVLDEKGHSRFLKYSPFDRTFVNRIDDYPYPYVISRLCWEFPCVAPSDWSAQHLQKPNNPLTVADLERAIDATVIKQGVFDLVFHPHGWIRAEQVNELIDYAVTKYGKRVKFLTFREALERLNKNLLAGQPLRDSFRHTRTAGTGRTDFQAVSRDTDGLEGHPTGEHGVVSHYTGGDGGVRLLDLNNDGFLDVVVGNQQLRLTRVWSPEQRQWLTGDFPIRLVAPVPDGAPQDAGAHFGIGPKGRVFLLANNSAWAESERGLWRFDGEKWSKGAGGLNGLELDGQPVYSAASHHDRGLRLRDLDGDGVSECLIANADQRGVFRWDESGQSWRRLPFDLPGAVAIVDEQGRDAGLRFVDLDEDGYDDVVFSNESGYSVDLFDSPERGWSRHVVSGKRPDDQLVPPIVSGGMNAGAWFAARHLWLQNEATDRLKDLVDRRASGELLKGVEPRAKSPAASLASIVTRPGFQVELVACEPLTMDPVAFAWGADGKLWIVEMADYPLGCEGGGRVRYLEDRDGDGRYDASTLFLDGLNYPNGVMPWRKGVLITCAPEIFYAEDSDGDGRADVRRSLYRGFGEGNPQHRVNGLRWGLDNWVYCANGDSGGGIESLLTGEKVSINGRDFRIKPDEGRIEPQTGQSQFQRERDDWGDWFGNNNSNPMYHFVLDDHYLRRNPHLAAGETRVQVSMAPGAAPVFPVSRTLERFNDQNAADRFTSACSAIVYRDDLFGPQFVGNSFVSEPVHNLVHREVVYAEGVTFHSRRADDEQRSEFLASTDNWFRPAMIRVGPDGALWIADMYRQVIEHPEWIPKDWQARLDLRAGHDKGRIYRVFPVGSRPRAMPRLDKLSTEDLVAALDSPGGWQRDMVQQLLIERGDNAAVALLKALLFDDQKPPLARLHAIGTLDGMKALDAGLLRDSLGIHPGIDRHVIRLSEPFLDHSPELANAVAQLADSEDPQVVMQLAYSLGEWHSADAGRVLGQLALRLAGAERPVAPGLVPGSSAVDLNAAVEKGRGHLITAILSSATHKNLAALVETVIAAGGNLDPLDDFVRRLAELTVAIENDDAQLALLHAIGQPRETGIARWQLTALDGFLDGVTRSRKVGTSHQNDPLGAFAENASQPIKDALAGLSSLFESARKTVGAADAPEDDRLRAMQLLGRTTNDRDGDIALLAGLLAPQSSSRLQSAAIAALAAIGDPQVPQVLLGGWQAYGPELRGQVIDALLARQAWVERLLEEVREQRLPAVALDAARRQRLLDHHDEKIRGQARTLLAGATDPNREKIVEQYRAATQLSGDAAHGAAVFKKSCASCHKLDGVGHAIGADLSALTNRSPEAMLVAIFDPSRAVEAKFLNYTAITDDGRTFNGILASEAGNSVTLLAADGKEIRLLRSEIEELAGSNKSLMPDGIEKDLTLQDTADLLAYLSGFKPPRKTFAGNEPKVVEPEALRGEFWLLADACEIYGKTLVFEPNYRNLGYWQSDDDHAIWSLNIKQPGKYAVSLDYACDNGAANQSLVVEVAGQRLTAAVRGTGNWDTYRQLALGKVELPAGTTRLTVRPEGPLKGPLIDLKSVRLRPVK